MPNVDSPNINFLFTASNDSHVHWMTLIAEKLTGADFMVFPDRNENADAALQSISRHFYIFKPGLISKLRPKVVIVGNDWGHDELLAILEARIIGIPTVCIQDGAIIFPDRVKRLVNTDYLFAFGPKLYEYLLRNNTVITGNPKFDLLTPLPLPETPRVMINCNFTYGINEDNRAEWINHTVSACEKANLDFFISQHPRDKAVLSPDLPVIRSNAYLVRQQLESATIVISRFSTLIYEGIATGRRVIYYNYHHEPYTIFEDDKFGVLLSAHSPEELSACLSEVIHHPQIDQEQYSLFMRAHLGTTEHDAAKRCADQLNEIMAKNSEVTGNTTPLQSGIEPEGNLFVDLIKHYKKHISELVTGNHWLEEQISIIQASNDDIKSGNEYLNGQIAKYEAAVQELNGGNKYLLGQIEKYEQTINILKAQINKLQQDENDAQRKLKEQISLNKTLINLVSKISNSRWVQLGQKLRIIKPENELLATKEKR